MIDQHGNHTLLNGCGPPAPRTMSEILDQLSVGLGELHDRRIRSQHPLWRGKALGAYLQRFGQRLARRSRRPKLAWRFRLLDTGEVRTRVYTGGYVYVHRELLAYLNREAELAALLCHEIGHMEAHHSIIAKWITFTHGWFFALPHWFWLQSQQPRKEPSFQLEADRLAVRCMRRSGYPPRALVTLLKLLGRVAQVKLAQILRDRPELASRTPPPRATPYLPARLSQLRRLLGKSGQAPAPLPADPKFLRRLEGLVVEPDTRAGHLVGRRYTHQMGGFELTVPAGWKTLLQPHRLVASTAGKRTFLLVFRSPKRKVSQAILSFVNARRRIRFAPPLSRGGLHGQVGRHDFGAGLHGQIAAFRARGRVYVVIVYGPKKSWASLAPTVAQVFGSLRAIRRTIPQQAHPWRIRLQRVTRSRNLKTWTACAPGPEQLVSVRLLNSLKAGARLKPGQWIKCLTRAPVVGERL